VRAKSPALRQMRVSRSCAQGVGVVRRRPASALLGSQPGAVGALVAASKRDHPGLVPTFQPALKTAPYGYSGQNGVATVPREEVSLKRACAGDQGGSVVGTRETPGVRSSVSFARELDTRSVSRGLWVSVLGLAIRSGPLTICRTWAGSSGSRLLSEHSRSQRAWDLRRLVVGAEVSISHPAARYLLPWRVAQRTVPVLRFGNCRD
jgi:hypothetical protein